MQFKLWEFGAAIDQGKKWERLSPSWKTWYENVPLKEIFLQH
jgi:hypothetical protein